MRVSGFEGLTPPTYFTESLQLPRLGMLLLRRSGSRSAASEASNPSQASTGWLKKIAE